MKHHVGEIYTWLSMKAQGVAIFTGSSFRLLGGSSIGLAHDGAVSEGRSVTLRLTLLIWGIMYAGGPHVETIECK